MLDTTTGEVMSRKLMHEGNDVREFYSRLPRPVLVGIEATESMYWFLNLMDELGIECRVGHPATNESGIIYLYSEHYMGKEEPIVHTEAIKARGAWIPGVIDPASKGRSQKDGTQLIELYRQQGLKLSPADNAVEAGIFACDQLMHAGKLKVFNTLSNFYSELRAYRRDQDGRVVKERDHLMDAMRYLIMSGRDRMGTKPQQPSFEERWNCYCPGERADAWMM